MPLPFAVANSKSRSRVMGRSASLLFLGGALIGTITAFLPTPEATDEFITFLLASLGYPSALLLFLFGARLPEYGYHAVMFCGAVIVSLGLYFAGPTAQGGVTTNMYVWVPLWICYFFPLRHGLLHVAAIAIMSAFPLVMVHGEMAFSIWLTLLGTNLVASVTVGTLAKHNRQLARIDPLTGAYNRSELEEAAERELARAERHGLTLSLVYLDLDHFKQINDTEGHAAGDRLLQQLGATARKQLRQEDIFARIGGDEFALLLPNCPQKEATEIVERLADSLPEGCTLSAGIANRHEKESWQTLQKRADQALYAAKHAGRNTYCIA